MGSWVAPRCVPGRRRFDESRLGIPTRAREPPPRRDGATRLEIGADDGNLTLAALDDFRGVFLDGGDADALEVREDRLASNAWRRSSAVFASSSVLWPAMDARSVGRAWREMRLNS